MNFGLWCAFSFVSFKSARSGFSVLSSCVRLYLLSFDAMEFTFAEIILRSVVAGLFIEDAVCVGSIVLFVYSEV